MESIKTFNQDEINELNRSLNLKFGNWLDDRFFKVEIDEDIDAVFVNCILQNTTKNFYYPVQSRIELQNQNLSHLDSIKFLISYIEAYFDEFFKEDESVYLPIEWKTYDCEGIQFQLRGQIENLFLDNLADRLLSGGHIEESELKGIRLGR